MRYAVVSSLLLGGIVFGVSGCNTDALTKRELVVYFKDDATMAQRVAALDACRNAAANVVAEPVTTSKFRSDQVGDIRFRTDHANDKQLAQVETCFESQPGVKGFDTPDLTN